MFPPLLDHFPRLDTDNFLNIVLQGNIPSEGGKAVAGTYVSDMLHPEIADAYGGTKNLIALLKMNPKAILVDLTKPGGRAAFDQFLKMKKKSAGPWMENPKRLTSVP